ncbi:MAG: hypothetical protein JXQ90_14690 [Cyclobacteriaceae bacterium]
MKFVIFLGLLASAMVSMAQSSDFRPDLKEEPGRAGMSIDGNVITQPLKESFTLTGKSVSTGVSTTSSGEGILGTEAVTSVVIKGTAITGEIPLDEEGSLGTAGKFSKIVNMSGGSFVFHLNGETVQYYGDINGDSLQVDSDIYFVAFDGNDTTYTLKKITTVGLIGTVRTGGTTGWDDPDTDMIDQGNGVYRLEGITLFAGEWKMRANDEWNAGNWGDDGADGTLEIGGANIILENLEGLYDVEVDILNNSYSITNAAALPRPGPFSLNGYPVSTSRIQLEWGNIQEFVDGFRIYRRADGDTEYTKIDSVTVGTTSYTDLSLPANTDYYYKIEAYNADTSRFSDTELFSTFSTGHSSRLESVRSFGGPDYQFSYGVSVDDFGNYYYAGRFFESISFGSTQLTATGVGSSAFVAKFGSTDNLLWAQAYESTGSIIVRGIESFGTSTYVVGSFWGDFYGNTSPGYWSSFLMKINSSGGVQWVRSMMSEVDGSVDGIDLAIDDFGNVYMAVEIDGGSTFRGSTVGTGPALVKYDQNGNEIWIRNGTPGLDVTYSIDGIVISNGSVYITGDWDSGDGTLSFGSNTLSGNETSYDIYVVSYGLSGALNWAIDAGGGNAWEYSYDITADNDGNIYVAGLHYGTFEIGSLSATTNGGGDGFIFKIDAAGNPIWVNSYGSPGLDYFLNIKSDGNWIYGSMLKSTLTADMDGVMVDNGAGAFVSIDLGGVTRYVETIEGEVVLRDMGIGEEYVYVAGAYDNTMQANGSIFNNALRGRETLLAKMERTLPLLDQPIVSASNAGVSSFDLSWNTVIDATDYHYEVSTTENFATLVNSETETNGTSVTISGLRYNTTYYCRVSAYNLFNGRISNYGVTEITTADDTSAPNIVTISYDPSSLATAQTVDAVIRDNGAMSDVLFFKKRALSSSFSESFAEVSGEIYTGQISATDFDNLGVSFFFRAIDWAGNQVESEVMTIRTAPSFNETQQMAGISAGKKEEDYTIISLPFKSMSAAEVFANLGPSGETTWRIWDYNGSSYDESVNLIQPGKGYWFIVSEDAFSNVSFSGVEPVEASESQPFSVSVRSGWNMIGNPYPFSINMSEINAHNGANYQLQTFKDGGYSVASTLKAYEGGWIESNSSGSIEFPFSAITGGRVDDHPEPRDFIVNSGGWEVIMSLNAEGGWSTSSPGIGENGEAIIGKDQFDVFSPPLFDRYLTVNFKEEVEGRMTRSIHPPSHQNVWEFEIQTHLEEGTQMTIDFTGIPNLNGDEKLVLFNTVDASITPITDLGSYQFTYRPGGKFVAIKGTDEFINETTRLEWIVASNIYPNPTDGQISLDLNLPETMSAYSVLLRITDLSGREVMEFDPLMVGAGKTHFNAELDGINKTGLYVLSINVYENGNISFNDSKRFFLNRR